MPFPGVREVGVGPIGGLTCSVIGNGNIFRISRVVYLRVIVTRRKTFFGITFGSDVSFNARFN